MKIILREFILSFLKSECLLVNGLVEHLHSQPTFVTEPISQHVPVLYQTCSRQTNFR